MVFLREIFLGCPDRDIPGARKVLLYILPEKTNSANTEENAIKSSASLGNLTITARCEGDRKITMIFVPDPDSEYSDGEFAVYHVQTVVDDIIEVDQVYGTYTDENDYTPAKFEDLQDNFWVTFKYNETDKDTQLMPTVGLPLTGGQNGVLLPNAYALYLKAIEPYDFDIMIYDCTDMVVKKAIAQYIKDLNYLEGKGCQAVIPDFLKADNELIYDVGNGYILNDGTELKAEQAVWWVGGTSAGADYNKGLTNARHPNAIAVSGRLGSTDRKRALRQGRFVFYEDKGAVRVLEDINSLTTFTKKKLRRFRKNRFMRTLLNMGDSIYEVYNNFYLGDVDDGEDGKNLLKGEILSLLSKYESTNGIQKFNEYDVEIFDGEEDDSVLIVISVRIMGSVDRIYVTIIAT